jgi:hypothetical protein
VPWQVEGGSERINEYINSVVVNFFIWNVLAELPSEAI